MGHLKKQNTGESVQCTSIHSKVLWVILLDISGRLGVVSFCADLAFLRQVSEKHKLYDIITDEESSFWKLLMPFQS